MSMIKNFNSISGITAEQAGVEEHNIKFSSPGLNGPFSAHPYRKRKFAVLLPQNTSRSKFPLSSIIQPRHRSHPRFTLSSYLAKPISGQNSISPSKREHLPSLFSQRVTRLPTDPAIVPLLAPEAKGILQLIEEVAQKDPIYPIAEGARGTEDVVSDISYLGRTLAQLGLDSPTYQAIGVTTGENLFMGFYAAYQAWNRVQKAAQIGDAQGTIEGSIDGARGVSQGIGGGFYLGYRGAMIASEIANVNATMSATTPLGKATFYTGLVGNFFFTLFYLFIALWGGYQLCLTGKFYHSMNQVNGLVPFLIGQVHGDVHERLQQLQQAGQGQIEKAKNRWEEKCLNEFSVKLEAKQKELLKSGQFKGKALSRSELRNVVRGLFEAIEKDREAKASYLDGYCQKMGLNSSEVAPLNLSPMQICGMKLEEEKKQQLRVVQLERVMGSGAVEKIKQAYRRGLAERLVSDDASIRQGAVADAEALEKAVRSGLNKNLIIFSSFLFMGLLGVIVSVATIGLFTLPAAGMFAATLLTVLLAMTMAGIDIYFWKSGLDSAKPGKYDKLFVYVIGAVLIGALALSAFLTFGLGFPVMPFVFTMVIGLVTLGICTYTLVKLHLKEKRWTWEHPDLEQMEKALADLGERALDEKTTGLFKKLSRSDRHAVRKQYDLLLNDGQLAQDGDIGRVQRAAQKAARGYWEKWHLSRNQIDRERALQLQRLIEQIKLEHGIGVKLQLNRIKEDPVLYAAYRADLAYLCKREGSAQDLRRIIQAVRTEGKKASVEFGNQQLASALKTKFLRWPKT